MNMDERVKKERALPKFNSGTSKTKGLGMDNYKVHCLFCQTDEHLQMHAHRVKGKMVGWVIVCLGCMAQNKHVNLKVK